MMKILSKCLLPLFALLFSSVVGARICHNILRPLEVFFLVEDEMAGQHLEVARTIIDTIDVVGLSQRTTVKYNYATICIKGNPRSPCHVTHSAQWLNEAKFHALVNQNQFWCPFPGLQSNTVELMLHYAVAGAGFADQFTDSTRIIVIIAKEVPGLADTPVLPNFDSVDCLRKTMAAPQQILPVLNSTRVFAYVASQSIRIVSDGWRNVLDRGNIPSSRMRLFSRATDSWRVSMAADFRDFLCSIYDPTPIRPTTTTTTTTTRPTTTTTTTTPTTTTTTTTPTTTTTTTTPTTTTTTTTTTPTTTTTTTTPTTTTVTIVTTTTTALPTTTTTEPPFCLREKSIEVYFLIDASLDAMDILLASRNHLQDIVQGLAAHYENISIGLGTFCSRTRPGTIQRCAMELRRITREIQTVVDAAGTLTIDCSGGSAGLNQFEALAYSAGTMAGFSSPESDAHRVILLMTSTLGRFGTSVTNPNLESSIDCSALNLDYAPLDQVGKVLRDRKVSTVVLSQGSSDWWEARRDGLGLSATEYIVRGWSASEIANMSDTILSIFQEVSCEI